MANQLWLDDWTVTKVEPINDTYRVAASYDTVPTDCGCCGVVGARLYKHGSKKIRYVDAPVHGLQTFIDVERLRFRCRECGGTFMQPLPDMDDQRRMTIRCREYIRRQCLLQPNTHVAETVGVDEKVVRTIGKVQAKELSDDHKVVIRAPRLLGLDETALGPDKTMCFILVDLATSWPIDLLPGREGPFVLNYLMHLPGREDVEIVATDMWDPYRKAIRVAMPQAVHIVDKWHVVRAVHDAMETARKRYGSKAETTDAARKDLKGSRKIFTRRPSQLSVADQFRLDGWLKNTPELQGAYEIKEAFMKIWDLWGVEKADKALTAWEASIPPHLRSLFSTLITHIQWQTRRGEGWRGEILSYFSTPKRYTNAKTEARNRVIKMVNRLGAGYSFDAIRARALFGKRPGRVRAERAAAEAERLATLATCVSCKALFEPAIVDAAHLQPLNHGAAPGPDNLLVLCPDCHRFHTETWFADAGVSTRKSE